ncbi:MAG: hypothetical protein Q9166_008170 [cf. Caloplaca sp. 2 TL-2023]
MAPPPPSPTTQAPAGTPSRRRGLLVGVLGLLILIWLLRSAGPSEPEVLHRAPRPQVCPKETLNVAIIGAGSAGASAAYYLNKFRQPCQHVNITVYERNAYVGGRTTTVYAYDDPDEPVELGGSIFVKVNHNLVNAAERFGLPINSMRKTSKSDKPEVLGVWDGQQFVFTQSDASNQYWNIAKLLWKYGMAPLRTQNLMKKTVSSFLKMYDGPYFPFKSLTEVAFDLDLLSATAATGQEFLAANGISEKFGRDIIQASTRVNYAQNLQQIHGLETMVCMATDGAMSIEGGNWQIFDNMIKGSGATLLLNTSVTTITKESGKYTVKTMAPVLDSAQDIPSTELTYDSIVLASPLQFSNITFEPALANPPPAIPYVSLHVTLFTSPYPLSPAAFNLHSRNNMPTTILTTTPPNDPNATSIPFNSISTLRTVLPPIDFLYPEATENDLLCGTRDPEYLYKIFSLTPLSSSYIESLLDTQSKETFKKPITWIHEKRWDSYPYLPPRITFEDTELEKGLWYTSGIESFISTMETSSLMGMNVARLVVDGWLENGDKNGGGW